jgi:hypothetical protein
MLDIETVLLHAIPSLLSVLHEEGSIYGLCARLPQILYEPVMTNIPILFPFIQKFDILESYVVSRKDNWYADHRRIGTHFLY